MRKPILSPNIEQQLLSAVAQYKSLKMWREWGLSDLRSQGAAILLYGPSGTGKTSAAIYLSQLIGKGMHQLNMRTIGGKHPGDSERLIADVFNTARSRSSTIFMDECDAVLVDRAAVQGDSFYMVGVINEILTQMDTYKGLVILSTNRFEALDSALHRRILVSIKIDRPERQERRRLWEIKIPKKFPLQLTPIQLDILSELPLTGAEIESAIIKCASEAITKGSLPTFQTLQQCSISSH